MASGIKDKAVILGMGCSKFGERWDASPADLMSEAFEESLADAGIDKNQIEMAWFGAGIDAFNVGASAMPLSIALRLPNIPVTKVENMCATGTEAFRGAVYAVASGACDIALALGVEKLKDVGYGGLPQRTRGVENDMYWPNLSAPGAFAQLASGYRAKHGVDQGDLKRAMAHVSVKSHANGAKNPKAHLQREITEEQAMNAPYIAEPIGLFDCCGVSDGAACAIVCTPEIARALGKADLVSVKALQLAASNGEEAGFSKWDGSYLKTTRIAAQRAYDEAGITKPRDEVSMTEVHDCFSITELVTMEDLQLSDEGQAVWDVLNGDFDADGRIPCQIDGGLKCFGHPIGASGLRMIYENYLQFHGRAGDRQLKDPRLALNHNLGGFPHQNICSISIIGRYE
ncbi:MULTISPECIES: acetyl-CoA acetyltransferase [Gammaproteobacteria]|jgi:acetyl-CoA C-acetyltransferase|uniref:Acetyl-CoA acetyltransferase n=2 Tax=Marinobacter TaxID=2742 RepID=A0ABW2IZD8_9GAMM|nr:MULTISPECIES: acetyl-CoA acetyltransferase [Gammaproteobacteria]MAO58506.1 acetyl-CoA acetyltransferase [Alcanivorax sp.]MCG2580482.1 acetyl-CoA acetyltransferase [Marinobacter sp.]GGE79949.1 acetyl-CoA acetyltransferase [Streptosporangium jomthongense]MAY08894.1 acetyl-CoA acetyltransferase [Alcanivorax sp.]MBI55548.1 acetyl-CoA acetyltransferase [Alcanivorax sp.]|tara:strand:- start:944 stop:2143 length:1200 start_codon:yes stop_codon:yes gene_type:complete